MKLTQSSSSAAMLTLFVLSAILAACSTPTASPMAPTAADAGSYPSPSISGNQADPSYPEPTPYQLEPAYPIPTEQRNVGSPVTVVPFKINRPVAVTATEITGTGPAGIPIALADATNMGYILAETTINPDGTFVFKLSEPLVNGNRIGIGLGDLTGTKWVADNFSDPGFEGEEPMLIPLEGYFFDTLIVGE